MVLTEKPKSAQIYEKAGEVLISFLVIASLQRHRIVNKDKC